jgi:hypothetical protein
MALTKQVCCSNHRACKLLHNHSFCVSSTHHIIPLTSSAVEVEEVAQERASALLHSKVEVQANLLCPGQQAVAIGEGPTRLHKGQVVIAHHVDDCLVQEVVRGLEVCVKDGDILKALVLHAGHAIHHGACLVTAAVVAAHQLHVVALLQAADHCSVHLLPHRLACGVIAHLMQSARAQEAAQSFSSSFPLDKLAHSTRNADFLQADIISSICTFATQAAHSC